MEHHVGTAEDYSDGRRRIVTIGDLTLGVFLHEGTYYAYRNQCPHQGGPVCEGIIIGRVEEAVDTMGRVGATTFSDDQNIVCPWHGMEFDLRTGIAWSDPKRRLTPYEVVERRGEIFVVV